MSVLQLCHRLAMGAASRARNLYYRALGVRMEGYCWLRRVSIPRGWADIRLGENVALDDGVTIVVSGERKPDKVVIGASSYVNRYTIFDAHDHLHIGRRVRIGPHCYFTDADHGTAPGASVQSQPMRRAPLIVEDEAWIGAHVVVLAGVRIGRGAVIGAGSVVTRDVPDMAVVAGVPAKLLRDRDGRKS
jgi:acetyltransferase-like isoleucine patch superfamily enzyme